MFVQSGGIYDKKLRNNDLFSDDFLQVNCCGITNNIIEKPLTIRPFGRKDYQLIILLAGKAIFKYNEETTILHDNEAIIIPPKVKNHYFIQSNSNIIWIHFTGTASEKILESYSLTPYKKFNVYNSYDFISYAEMIIEEFQLRHVGYMNNCNAYLLNILTLLKRKIENEKKKSDDNFVPELTPVLEDMKTNFSQKRDIAEYAAICNLSSSRFSHLFTEKIGVSPYQYLLNIRLKQAIQLMINTNLPISAISKNVGYDDPLYFSSIFKKHIGISPSNFRKNNGSKETVKQNSR